MSGQVMTDSEFELFRAWVYDQAGISMSPAKKPLIMSRLQRRVAHFGLQTYAQYYKLTTNETYFFREPKHFEFLRDRALAERRPGTTFRVWSAACSSGEEPWSIAMLLASKLGDMGWEILASDISTRVLDRAQSAHYAIERAEKIPRPYLTRFCQRGVNAQEGTFRIVPELRRRVKFMQVNLIAPLPDVGTFDLIFLRNVLIYFDMQTKAAVVRQLCNALRPGGYFYCGHSESLHGMGLPLTTIQPAVYQRQ